MGQKILGRLIIHSQFTNKPLKIFLKRNDFLFKSLTYRKRVCKTLRRNLRVISKPIRWLITMIISSIRNARSRLTTAPSMCDVGNVYMGQETIIINGSRRSSISCTYKDQKMFRITIKEACWLLHCFARSTTCHMPKSQITCLPG